MTRSVLTILFFTIIVASCSEKDRIPRGILPQSSMESVLWDMISADEYIAGYVLLKNPSLNRKEESLQLYQKVFSIHNITAEEFENSLRFYQSHPSLLMVVLDSMSAKHTTLPARRERFIPADSLKIKVKAIE